MSANPIFLSTVENNLMIRIRPDSILYSVTDENEQTLLRQEINMIPGKKANSAVYEHFFNQPELDILSENVSILLENNAWQLIPDELFREENMNDLFEMEFGKSDDELLKYMLMPKWGMHLVYRVPAVMIGFFEEKYSEVVFEHHISRLLKKSIVKSAEAVYANLRKDAVDIFAVKGSMLHLAGTFEVKTNEDISYFILNVYEQLELDTESFTLNIITENNVNEELVKMIGDYVVNIKSSKI